VLGKLDFDEEIIMKNINYRRVQLLVKLATAFVKLGQEILKLLDMAFNYYANKKLELYALHCKMDIKI
jgi:hypothetical protein